MLWRTQSRPSISAHSVRALAAVLLLVGVAAHARADEAAADQKPVVLAGEVFVFLASEKEGAIDPSLAKVRALKHPPFNNYKSMKILSRQTVKLVAEERLDIYLDNGRLVQLTLVALLPDGRAKVSVSINRANEKDYLRFLYVIASPGEPFFVAGQKFDGGTLVIGVRVGERPLTKQKPTLK
jgi:hypothetical protein